MHSVKHRGIVPLFFPFQEVLTRWSSFHFSFGDRSGSMHHLYSLYRHASLKREAEVSRTLPALWSSCATVLQVSEKRFSFYGQWRHRLQRKVNKWNSIPANKVIFAFIILTKSGRPLQTGLISRRYDYENPSKCQNTMDVSHKNKFQKVTESI